MKSRQANIELLRVVAMSIILIWHFFFHGGIMLYQPVTRMLTPLLIIGVPIFVMISGYFRIKAKLTGYIKLSLTILIFSGVSLIATKLLSGDFPVGYATIAKLIVGPMFGAPYWFVVCYCGLFLLSPLLNRAFDTMDLPAIRKTVLILFLAETIYCWALNSNVDYNGYTIFYFIYAYSIGVWLSRETFADTLSSRTLLFIMLGALTFNCIYAYFELRYFDGFLPTVNYEEIFGLLRVGKYNNPFTVVIAACMLLLFRRIKLGARAGRLLMPLAAASFGCYLLQDGYFRHYLYSQTAALMGAGDIGAAILAFLLQFLALWSASLLLTHFLIAPLTRLLLSLLNRRRTRLTTTRPLPEE